MPQLYLKYICKNASIQTTLIQLIFSRAYEMEVPDGYDVFLCDNDFILSTIFTRQYKS